MDRCSPNIFLEEVKIQNTSTNPKTAQDVWDRAHSAIIAAGRRFLGVSEVNCLNINIIESWKFF